MILLNLTSEAAKFNIVSSRLGKFEKQHSEAQTLSPRRLRRCSFPWNLTNFSEELFIENSELLHLHL